MRRRDHRTVRFSIVSTELFRVTNLNGYIAELRSQELTRVAGYPQGPLRKLKADENDIFNGNGIIVCCISNHTINVPPLCFQRRMSREMNVRLRYTIGCRTSLLVRMRR